MSGVFMAGNDILSRIQVLLDADTANFSVGMQKAKGESKSTFESIRENATKMGTAVVAGSVAAVGALIAMADAQAQQAQQIEIAAYKAQASTTEFQKNSIAARQVGIETEQLGDIYKDFNEKVGEMITAGSGGMVDWMEQVAVKTEGGADGAMRLAKEMATLSGPAAMGVYVAKMEEANLSLDQQNFLMESMASESQMLLPLYRDNAEQVRLWGDAAERTGMILDEQGIQKAAEFRVQSELLKMQLEGAKTQLVQAVIPAFVDIADAFNTGDKEARAMADGGEVLANILRGVAAIAMGLYTTVNLVANTMAGVAVSATNAMNVVDQAAQAKSAKWYDKLPGVKLFKASVLITADIQNPDSVIADMKKQNQKIVEEGAAMIGKVFDNATSEAAAKMADIYGKSNDAQAKATQGTKDWIDKQNEATKASAALNNALQEQNRILEEQKRDREQISKAYASDFQNLVWDEAEELERIRKAGFSPAEQEKYLALAKQRFDAENAEYFKNLNLEFNQYKWTEEKKLQYAYEMDREIAENDVKIANEVRESKLKFLDEQYQHELKNIQLAREKRIFESNKAFMTSSEIMVKHYALERQEIEQTIQDLEERNAALNASYHNEDEDSDKSRRGVWNNYRSRNGGLEADLVGAEEDFESRNDKIQAAYDWQLITQEQFQAAMIQSERDYNVARANLQLQYGMSYVQGAAGVLAQVLGENSKAYQAMFAMQKAMAIAQVMMNAPTTFSNVYTSVSQIPYVGWVMAPVAAGAAVALQLAQAATIGSVSFNPAGMAHDGIDRIPEEGSWWLDKGERVLTEQTSSKLDNTLEEIRRGNREPTYDASPVQQPVYNIQALDGKSVERVLKKHSRHVAGSMKGYARNFGR